MCPSLDSQPKLIRIRASGLSSLDLISFTLTSSSFSLTIKSTTLDTLIQNLELIVDEQALTNLATKTYPVTEDEPAGQQNAKLTLQPQISALISDAQDYNLTNNPDLTYNVEKCKRIGIQ